MNIFKEQELRFAARLPDQRLLISCQTANGAILADPDGRTTGLMTAEFNKPQDITVDPVSGEIYVVDRYNHCVKVFNQDFMIKRVIGKGELNQPVGIVFNKHNAQIYVADNENHRIAVFNPSGALIQTIGKGFGHNPNQLFCPCGVAVYKDLVIVAEWGNGRLQIFRDSGESVLVIPGIPHAHHVVVDPDGTIYVAQYSDKLIRKFKIFTNDDRTLGFIISTESFKLDEPPCGLFCDNGKLGVVTKTHLQYVQMSDV